MTVIPKLRHISRLIGIDYSRGSKSKETDIWQFQDGQPLRRGKWHDDVLVNVDGPGMPFSSDFELSGDGTALMVISLCPSWKHLLVDVHRCGTTLY